MITSRMKRFLEEIAKSKVKDRRKYNIYLNRIQERIDRELESLNWLTKNHPQLFLDEEREYEDKSLERHRRLKALIKSIQNLNPRFAVELRIIEDETIEPPSWWKENTENDEE